MCGCADSCLPAGKVLIREFVDFKHTYDILSPSAFAGGLFYLNNDKVVFFGDFFKWMI